MNLKFRTKLFIQKLAFKIHEYSVAVRRIMAARLRFLLGIAAVAAVAGAMAWSAWHLFPSQGPEDPPGPEGPEPIVPTSFIEPVTGMEFVLVTGGCYKMGCDQWSGDCADKDTPPHEVCVDDFWMGRYEVTQKEWASIEETAPSAMNNIKNPVDSISWDSAQHFIQQLNQAGLDLFRLPTEAEWEYACRSGGKEEIYCGGNEPGPLAWYGLNSGGSPHPVGEKDANGIEIHDMSGNLSEWCQDAFVIDAYNIHERDNPVLTFSDTKYRVLRGGNWEDREGIQSTYRFLAKPDAESADTGFRLAMPILSKERADEILQHARTLIDKDNWPRAILCLEQLQAVFKDEERLQTARERIDEILRHAEILLNRGRWDEAGPLIVALSKSQDEEVANQAKQGLNHLLDLATDLINEQLYEDAMKVFAMLAGQSSLPPEQTSRARSMQRDLAESIMLSAELLITNGDCPKAARQLVLLASSSGENTDIEALLHKAQNAMGTLRIGMPLGWVADLTVDGKDQGRAPVAEIQLSCGSHRIELQYINPDDNAPLSQWIKIFDSKRTTMIITTNGVEIK